MDTAAKGASALSENEYPAALTFYTKALIDHPTSPDYFTQRSIAFTRVSPPRPDLALKDAEYAVLLGQRRAKREKIQAGQIRRVVALYGLGRYADAKAVLETTLRWQPKESKPAKMEYDMWMARIEKKLKTVTEGENGAIEGEYPAVVLPSDAEITKALKSQLTSFGSFKLEGDEAKKEELLQPGAPTAASDNTSNSTAKPPNSSTTAPLIPTKIRHEWYQSPETITITLYAKAVSKSACEIDIQEDSVHVSFPHPSNPSSTFTFTLDPLFALIDPSQSKGAVLSTKFELTLRKSQAGQKWHNLEGTTPPKGLTNTETATTTTASTSQTTTQPNPPQPTTTPQGPSYPTSSRTGPKNWDKLANDLSSKPPKPVKPPTDPSSSTPKNPSSSEAEPADEDDSDTGGDAVDGFFKKLYAGADADTRRAMMKSFTESNGTALSTNWKDVGSKKVEEVRSSKD